MKNKSILSLALLGLLFYGNTTMAQGRKAYYFVYITDNVNKVCHLSQVCIRSDINGSYDPTDADIINDVYSKLKTITGCVSCPSANDDNASIQSAFNVAVKGIQDQSFNEAQDEREKAFKHSASVSDRTNNSYKSLSFNYKYSHVMKSERGLSTKDPEMIVVEGGSFLMGNNEGADDAKPAHPVTLSSFSMSKYPITQAQWQAVMGSNPSYHKYCDNCPVEQVSWADVQEYIKRLNSATGKNYRLPTEAEWEYAARGGNKSRGYIFAGSNTLDEVAWYSGNSNEETHQVGQKQPNELGLFDMSGNVFQWCSDWYGADYYYQSATIDPLGPLDGGYRIIRGGSCFYGNNYCGVSLRDITYPSNRNYGVGFRLVLSR